MPCNEDSPYSIRAASLLMYSVLLVSLSHSDDYFAPVRRNRAGAGEEKEDGDNEKSLGSDSKSGGYSSTTSLIIHPSTSSKSLHASSAAEGGGGARPLWRKRETMRQERTVHYTTIDADGEQQVGRGVGRGRGREEISF
jgi:hypothetical protein